MICPRIAGPEQRQMAEHFLKPLKNRGYQKLLSISACSSKCFHVLPPFRVACTGTIYMRHGNPAVTPITSPGDLNHCRFPPCQIKRSSDAGRSKR